MATVAATGPTGTAPIGTAPTGTEISVATTERRARVVAELKVAADVAAKSAAYLAGATFLLMLIGLFGAIFGARIDGRDERAAS